MKDRTAEFYALVERMKKRGSPHQSFTNKRNQPLTRSEFSRMAAQLSKNIANTSEKLEQLTYLTKSGNGLDLNPIDMNNLTQSIKQDINRLNQQIKILQSVKNTTRGSKQASEHTNNVIVSLQTKLADTSLGFKNVLELEVDTQYNNNTQVQFNSPQPRRRINAHHTSHDDSPQSLGIPMIAPQQQLLMMEQNDREIQSRTNAMENIQSTIAELGGIFQQLATMVAEQRETIQRIDQNTDDIEMNVLGAQSELLKYYTNISSNRGLIIKVFITIIALFLFFTMVL